MRRAKPAVVPEPAAPQPPLALPRFVAPPQAPTAAPASAQLFPRFQAPVAPQPPAPPTRPAPVSTAGADLPAALAPTAPTPLAPPLPEEPLAARLAEPAPAPRRAAPAEPTPPPARTPGAGSAPPPGFHAEGLVIAASAELLALDPSLDDESAQFAAPSAIVSAPLDPALAFDPSTLTPEEAASLAGPLRVSLPAADVPATPEPTATASAPPAEIGGSRLLGTILAAFPHRGDLAAARRRDLPAAGRLVLSAVVIAVVLVLAGGRIVDLLAPVPLVGSAADTLAALALYPSVYGIEWVTATLAIFALAGVVFAHMEKQAERHGMRRDPVRRLNIALATLLTLTLGAGAMSLLHDEGWAAAASATAFFAALCLAIPLARTPGARAMAPQPERAWAALFLISVPAVFIASTIPTLVIAALAFTHVRTRWSQVVENTDEHASGPLDRSNRLGAMIITAAVVIVAAIGFNAMHQSTDQLRGLQQQERTAFPGAIEGPTVDEATPTR